jgi:hypothetical protein
MLLEALVSYNAAELQWTRCGLHVASCFWAPGRLMLLLV